MLKRIHTRFSPPLRSAPFTLTPLTIAGIYAVLGSLWIFCSDQLLDWLVADRSAMIHLSVLKGWLYIILTAYLLYVLSKRHVAMLSHSYRGVQRSEAQLQALLDNSPAVIYIKDLEGQYLLINRQFASLAGLQPEVVLGKTDDELFPPAVAETLQANDRTVLASGTPLECEESVPLQDGWHTYLTTKFPLSDSLRGVYAVCGISTDISDRVRVETERRQAESEIQRLNETLEAQVLQRTAELETLLNTLPDYVFVIERDQMRFSFGNHKFTQALGFSDRHEIQGKTIFECFSVSQAEEFAQQNRQVFESGQALQVQETVSLATGRTYHLDTYKIPLRTVTGEIYALLGTSHDITELVEIRRALSQRTTALENANHQLQVINQELDAFSYSVSHDLRAPLRHINGFLGILMQHLEEQGMLVDTQVARCCERVQQSSEKMNTLIESLLCLAQVGRHSLVMQPVSLRPLAEKEIALIQSQIDSGTDPIDFVVGDLPIVMGDATLLQQVLSNLLDNAVKFSRPSRLKPKARGHTARVEVNALPDGTVFVKDNGVGLPMTTADQLFGAFQRFHSSREFEGTGIGLAIVQRIVHRHGGTIWVESVLGEGACFYFKLGVPLDPSRSRQ